MNITSTFFPFYKKIWQYFEGMPNNFEILLWPSLYFEEKRSVLPEKKKALLTTYLRSPINLKIPFMLKINLNKTNSV
jgi:hypothetical protein